MSLPTALASFRTPTSAAQEPLRRSAPPAADAGTAIARRLALALAALADRPQDLQAWARLAMRDGPRRQAALDQALYRHVHDAGQPGATPWLCALVCAEVSSQLHWSPALQQGLVLAALSQTRPWQGRAWHQPSPDAMPLPSCGCRSALCARAEAGAKVLQQAEFGPALWPAVVRLAAHHCEDKLALDRLAAPARAARLLRRVVFFLRLTGRGQGVRTVTLVAAARRACLGHDGVPDELGNALLQAVGIYPAGSLLRLHGGEAGVVVGRGPRANLPLVAALVDGSGTPLTRPRLRHTEMARHAVQGSWLLAAAAQVVPRRPPWPAS